MNDPKEEIIKALKKVSETLEVDVERPKNENFGDYTTNIALVLGKKLGKSPTEVAEELAQKLLSEQITSVEKVEAVGGFINFWLSQDYLQNQVVEIIKLGSNYGSSDKFKGKRASVEFVSANPTGPLHIGNARGGPIGDILSNVLSKVGYKVTREYLHNDVGGQVQKLGQSIYYTLNPAQKPEEELAYQGEYIKDLAKEVRSLTKSNDPDDLGKIAVEILFNKIMDDTKTMGIKFDKATKESDLRKKVPEILESIKKVIKEKDGALWFAPSDEFLKDRETVVQKSDKEYTYFASDIVYHKEKMEDSDLVVDVLGGNHASHVPRLQAAIKALGFDVSKFRVILYQFVRLKEGDLAVKMSKRLGNIITAREVLKEVGRDAFRFFLLTSGPDTHMDFDLELAKKKAKENPVYYIQYAYSRIYGIFSREARSRSAGAKQSGFISPNVSLLEEREELDLIRQLIKFPDLVEETADSFYVHLLTAYALELANLFHKFYETHQVISADLEKTKARLALLSATAVVIKETLTLLGIEAPERM